MHSEVLIQKAIPGYQYHELFIQSTKEGIKKWRYTRDSIPRPGYLWVSVRGTENLSGKFLWPIEILVVTLRHVGSQPFQPDPGHLLASHESTSHGPQCIESDDVFDQEEMDQNQVRSVVAGMGKGSEVVVAHLPQQSVQ